MCASWTHKHKCSLLLFLLQGSMKSQRMICLRVLEEMVASVHLEDFEETV